MVDSGVSFQAGRTIVCSLRSKRFRTSLLRIESCSRPNFLDKLARKRLLRRLQTIYMYKNYYLFQLVEHPTRGNNILDLVITNTPTFITAGPMTGPQWSDTGVPSDHFPVIFDLSVDVRLKGNIRSKRYDFKRANFESLKQTLLLI